MTIGEYTFNCKHCSNVGLAISLGKGSRRRVCDDCIRTKRTQVFNNFKAKNPEKIKNNHRKFRDTDKARSNWLKYRYGISFEEYNVLLETQNYKCQTCKKEEQNEKFCVDHCHQSGKIRGLLCKKCNSVLGFVHDNTETLRAMIAYLEKNAP